MTFVTVRNSTCGKVMFYKHLSFCPQGKGGGMRGRGCVHGRGDVHGRWACMAGGHAWQERRPLQLTVAAGMHSCLSLFVHVYRRQSPEVCWCWLAWDPRR